MSTRARELRGRGGAGQRVREFAVARHARRDTHAVAPVPMRAAPSAGGTERAALLSVLTADGCFRTEFFLKLRRRLPLANWAKRRGTPDRSRSMEILSQMEQTIHIRATEGARPATLCLPVLRRAPRAVAHTDHRRPYSQSHTHIHTNTHTHAPREHRGVLRGSSGIRRVPQVGRLDAQGSRGRGGA